VTILEEAEINIQKIESIFSKLFEDYHNPTNFIAQAEALVQALRNFTWFLQSKKSGIDKFDEWYGPWQELMKQNPYMRFIVEMRNGIVKQGIDTAKSQALILLYTDYRQTLLEKRLDVRTTTDEMRKEISKLAEKNPALNHATGEIQRIYIFNYPKKDDLEVIDTLFYCFIFISKLYDDFNNFLKTGSIQKNLEKVIAPNVDVSDLSITFRIKDGLEVKQNVIRVDRDNKFIEEYKAEYGDIRLKHDINSDNAEEKLRAKIEFAQLNKKRFSELLPVLEYHCATLNDWEVIFPMFRNRADKIHFWKDFANKVLEENIDKIIFTSDAYIYRKSEDAEKIIKAGKEISSMPNLEEQLISYYLDNSGKIITATSKYSVNGDGIEFQNVIIKEDTIKNNAMFAAVFVAWGLGSKKK
jgi:hypothetical protein